ncbi:ParB/RepB/Spo0J family partition protein [Serratia fonticola]|uniref:ParB/RepB/Spo0J family partition protein n=1 Tax=Serratia fonticola TaxID=47917 RepID=UPI00217BBB1E|nr:DNA-binding protein [Serratia fonticola]CAI1702748.1 ParB/RepB/Spo0J family partition protein [Serratia fonticola]
MATLSQRYAARESIGSDISTRKTFMVPLNEIYAEEGYNVRELNQAHVEEFRDSWIAGEFIPPLAVEITEKGVKVIDGHHRYHGALLASAAGHEVLRLECKDFVGTEADKIAFMVTSSQGLALSPIERGAAYQRLVNQGWTNSEIAKKVKRSESDILQHLQLQECTPYVKSLVRAGSMNYSLAIQLNREHGVYADREAARLMKKAEDAGKTKVTKSIAQPQFSAKKARRALELLFDAETVENGDEHLLRIHPSVKAELLSILQEYRHENKPTSTSNTASTSEPVQTDGDQLPLLKTDIISKSGIEVWACAAAAFGDKDDFLFHESKFAHTWAADSFENPEAVVVPTETIYKAKALITQYQEAQELRTWLNEKCDNAEIEVLDSMFERLHDVSTETIGDPESPVTNMCDFISLLENIPLNKWENIRLLRAELRSAVEMKATSDEQY